MLENVRNSSRGSSVYKALLPVLENPEEFGIFRVCRWRWWSVWNWNGGEGGKGSKGVALTARWHLSRINLVHVGF